MAADLSTETLAMLEQQRKALVDTKENFPFADKSRCVALAEQYAHAAACVRFVQALPEFITGQMLLDVDSCAMATATESHDDVAARDLRERIAKRIAAYAAAATGGRDA